MSAPSRTPACAVVQPTLERDAAVVIWRARKRGGFSLRRCPYCLSTAVRKLRREDLEDGRARLLLRCGECGTWRGELATRRSAGALERQLRRDRERMARLAPVLDLRGAPFGDGSGERMHGDRSRPPAQ